MDYITWNLIITVFCAGILGVGIKFIFNKIFSKKVSFTDIILEFLILILMIIYLIIFGIFFIYIIKDSNYSLVIQFLLSLFILIIGPIAIIYLKLFLYKKYGLKYGKYFIVLNFLYFIFIPMITYGIGMRISDILLK